VKRVEDDATVRPFRARLGLDGSVEIVPAAGEDWDRAAEEYDRGWRDGVDYSDRLRVVLCVFGVLMAALAIVLVVTSLRA
jgi:hypothetical protein